MNQQDTSQAATLIWGVKQSFRQYVEGSGGSIQAFLGATRDEDGAFVFPAAPDAGGLSLDADGALGGRGGFVGEVSFQAHGGMLSVFLADPSLEIGPEGAFVTVADSPERTRRLPLAKLNLAGMAREANGDLVIPAVMSNEGWQILGDHYMPGTPIDPLRLRLAR